MKLAGIFEHEILARNDGLDDFDKSRRQRQNVPSSVGRQHQNGEFSAGQILLRVKVAIGRDQQIEAAFHLRQQPAVADVFPAKASVVDGCHLMAVENVSELNWHVFVEKNSQSPAAFSLTLASSRQAMTSSRQRLG